jgi:hypothetical protein
MELHPNKDAEKTRKRLTYRQKVLNIYPEAICDPPYGITVRDWTGSMGHFDCCSILILTDTCREAKVAWKLAWKNIQKEMLLRLERD